MSSSVSAVSQTDDRGIIARRLTFGVGSLATGVFTTVPSILLLYYLTTHVRVQPAFAGVIVVTPKLVSIFTDPIVGHLGDRIKARGEASRRWFMSIGALSAGLGLWSVFSLTTRVANGGWLAAILYFACVLGFSFFAVPYVALPADIEESAVGRRGLVSTRMIFAFGGGLVGAVAAPVLVGWTGYGGMGMAVGLFCAATVGLCVSTYAGSRHLTLSRSSIQPLSMAALSDRRYQQMLTGFVLFVTASSSVSAALPFLVEGLFRQPASALSEALLVNVGAGLAATMLWPLLLRRVGYGTAWQLAGGLMVAGVAFMATAGSINLAFHAGLIFGGLGFAGVQVVGFVALADAANRAESSGRSGSGIMTGLWLAGEKVGFAVGPLLVGLVMQFVVVPGSSTRAALIIATGVLPAGLAAIAMLALSYRGKRVS